MIIVFKLHFPPDADHEFEPSVGSLQPTIHVTLVYDSHIHNDFSAYINREYASNFRS